MTSNLSEVFITQNHIRSLLEVDTRHRIRFHVSVINPRKVMVVAVALCAGAALPGAQEAPETTSLLGRPLRSPELPAETHATYEANLEQARKEHDLSPASEDAIIWLGRRSAYLGRYREAIAIYTRGLELHPDSPQLLRHRGHRYLTVRQLDNAQADLARAAKLIEGKPDEIEPDGIPNAKNTPTSTLHFNIRYHLALTHYLKGDMEAARGEWERCMEVSKNNDSIVAVSRWLYSTLRRLGRDDEAARLIAPIQPDMEVIENQDYLDLILMYKGVRTPEALLEGRTGLSWVTVAYGAAVWQRGNGREAEGRRILEQIVDPQAADHPWASFGYLAAEAELAALTK